MCGTREVSSPAVERSGAAAVFLGAVAGASLRWWLMELAGDTDGFPWMLFAIDVAGSGLLGAVVVQPWRHPLWTLLLGAGFCGSFTTFSAFAVVAADFLRDDRFGLAVVYVGATVATGVVAALVGQRLRVEAG